MGSGAVGLYDWKTENRRPWGLLRARFFVLFWVYELFFEFYEVTIALI